MTIYVGNLPWAATEQDLRDLFEPFGAVTRATIATDRETGRSRGFGFIQMPNEAEALAAIQALAGSRFDGRVLTVNEAKPRANAPRR
jgi:RNA recognition motif-containing protein